MKRLKAVLVLSVCLCLCGCGTRQTPPQTTGFTSVISFSAGELSATATLVRTDVGQLSLTCLTPPTLAGVRVTLDGEQISVSRGKLSFDVPLATAEKTAPFWRLCRVLDSLSCKTDFPAGDVVEGVCDSVPYRLTFDPKTGILRSLEMTNGDFSVAFSDFLSHSE